VDSVSPHPKEKEISPAGELSIGKGYQRSKGEECLGVNMSFLPLKSFNSFPILESMDSTGVNIIFIGKCRHLAVIFIGMMVIARNNGNTLYHIGCLTGSE
jgi:hypothetical protein